MWGGWGERDGAPPPDFAIPAEEGHGGKDALGRLARALPRTGARSGKAVNVPAGPGGSATRRSYISLDRAAGGAGWAGRKRRGPQQPGVLL